MFGFFRGGSNPGWQGIATHSHQPWRERKRMPSERSRLLVLLVLLSVVATAGWTTALAGGRTDPPTVSSLCSSVSKPPLAPTSGEPDVGQTPRPTPTTGSMSPVPRGEGGNPQGTRADTWFRWIIRMLTMRYLGAR